MMNTVTTIRTTHRLGTSITQVIVLLAITVMLLAITLPVLAMTSDTAGIMGSKRNLAQLSLAHRMYAADHNGNQWVNGPHDLAAYGDTYEGATENWIDSLGGSDHPMVVNGQWATWVGWGMDPGTGTVVHWTFQWNGFAIPLHMDGTASPGATGRGSYRMFQFRSFNPYVNGKVYDQTFFAPKHGVALAAIGDCFDDPYEYCTHTGGSHSPFWTSYSLSPAAMFHPDIWTEPENEFAGSMDDIFSRYPHAFQVLPYTAAKYPDLKTHVMEHFWLQNVDSAAGDCNDALPLLDGRYDGCASWLFNSSMDSAPATLFYDGHVRLLPLMEVKQADEKIGVWRHDTPIGFHGYFGELAWDSGGYLDPNPSHHILTNGGILGRDTLGLPSAR